MEHDYKGYVIRTFTREAEVYRLGRMECLRRLCSLDAAMRWIDQQEDRLDPATEPKHLSRACGGTACGAIHYLDITPHIQDVTCGACIAAGEG